MKKIICVLAAIFLIAISVSVPAFADSATISLSKSSVTVGSNVTVTVRYNAGFAMYGIDATLKYNSSVLQYVSGGGAQSGSEVKIVESLSGETSKSFTVTFKAIAAGSGSLSLSAEASGSGNGSASSGATVNVTAAQPSSNANLGSIKLSEGTLSPAFKQGTTSYSASVKYQTEKITISANAAAGDSVVSGAGTFNLKVGDNSFTLTVTAASGAKKSYTVNVHRMTEEETAAALQAERDNNPSLIVVNGVDKFLQTDLSGLGQIDGFTLSSVQRKGADIPVFSDNAGKYTLYWATDASGQDGAFYTADDNDEFTRLNAIRVNSVLYIIEPFEEGINVDARFIPGEYDMNSTKIACYKYADADLSDFYIFNCYVNGSNDYYSFDSTQNTMQREPLFIAKEVQAENESKAGLLDKFKALNNQAKIVLGLLLFAVVLVFVLIILLIMKAVNKSKQKAAQFESDENIDFNSLFGDQTEINPGNDEDISPEIEKVSEEIEQAVELNSNEETNSEEPTTDDENEFLDSETDF